MPVTVSDTGSLSPSWNVSGSPVTAVARSTDELSMMTDPSSGGHRNAMDRVRAALGEPSARPSFDRFREALSRGPMTRLFVRSGASIVPLVVSSVSWFEAWGDYVTAHAGSSRHVMHLALNRLEERLDPAKFVRIHRAHIVNLDHVKTFKTQGRGKVVAEMTDGTQLPVSRSRAQSLRGLGA